MDKELEEFIASIEHDKKREDAERLLKLMAQESGYEPYLDGKIVSFGSYHYKYESGREGDCAVTGFAPAKTRFSVYIMPGFSEYGPQLEKLGKHKHGKCCLYINKLADVDETVLREIVRSSVEKMKKNYPCQERPR